MAKRSYHQHCGLAVALDTLAERWTLLIIRDLLPGPRRFSDLFDGLAGVSTDLLADRLRTLQEHGVIEHQQLRHPAPAKVYALTPYGEELRPIIAQLARFGEQLLPKPGSETHRLDHRWMLSAMASAYTGGLEPGEYQLDVEGDVATIEVGTDDAALRYGPASQTPVLSLTCTVDWLSSSAWTQQPDLGAEDLRVVGDPDIVLGLFATLRAPRR